MLLALALVAVGCGGGSIGADDRPTVVVTTTILGDITASILGDMARVEVLMPVGADPHDFQASSAQLVQLNDADLVIANGLGLEEGLVSVLEASEDDGTNVLYVGPHLDPMPFHGTDSIDETNDDPHVWLDPVRVVDAVDIIVAEMGKIDSTRDWESQGEIYKEEVRVADWELQALFGAIPPSERIMVTNHDSLGYLADRYGLRVVGVVIPGGSTLAEPSLRDLAALVETIEREDVSAIFAETTQPTSLADSVAAEIGHPVAVVELYTGSLGESGSGAETYLDMMRLNAQRIATGLGG